MTCLYVWDVCTLSPPPPLPLSSPPSPSFFHNSSELPLGPAGAACAWWPRIDGGGGKERGLLVCTMYVWDMYALPTLRPPACPVPQPAQAPRVGR